MKKVCVYCGSSDKIPQVFLDAARSLGATLASRGMTLVYGAGSTGLMGAVADGALQAGGEVWGVIPRMFDTPQLSHKGLTRFEVVDNMHLRKARLVEISDGFIALPGGFGTFEELFEVLTWAQIGLHRKPIGLLNHLDSSTVNTASCLPVWKSQPVFWILCSTTIYRMAWNDG